MWWEKSSAFRTTVTSCNFLTHIGFDCSWSSLSWHVLIMSENVEYKTVGAYIGLQRKARLLLGHPLLIKRGIECWKVTNALAYYDESQ
jgi:hypothetical protein